MLVGHLISALPTQSKRGDFGCKGPLDRVNAETVKAALPEYVKPSAKLFIDDASHYAWADKQWPGGHETANHSAKQYVRGEASTNAIEEFFSLS